MGRIARTVALFLLPLAVGLACRGPGPAADRASCAHLESGRRVRGIALCEDVWTCERPPGGPLDRVGVRRIAICGSLLGPVALVLPDRYMSSDSGQTDAETDLRLYLAQAGVQTWSLDYRSLAADQLGEDAAGAMAAWTLRTFVGDVAWATAFARGVTPKPVALIGIGDGATLAYAAAHEGVPGVGGIVAVDGAMRPAPEPTTSGGLVEARVGALDWQAGQPLVRSARLGARNPSPVPGFVTAGEALADALHRAPGWGAPGGLANARLALSDPESAAAYLAAQDRWWPAALARRPVDGAPRAPVPVLAFAAGARGEDWVAIVREDARAFGGERTDVRVLGGHGHLDVILGRQAARRVYEPIRRWLGS